MVSENSAGANGKHLPTCSCQDCREERLKILKEQKPPSQVTICPRCKRKSLWFNTYNHVYECLNLECKATSTSPNDIAPGMPEPPPSRRPSPPIIPSARPNRKTKSSGGRVAAIIVVVVLVFGGLYAIGVNSNSPSSNAAIVKSPNTSSTTYSPVASSASSSTPTSLTPATTTKIPLTTIPPITYSTLTTTGIPPTTTTTIPVATYSGINPTTGKFGSYYLGLVLDNGSYVRDSYGNPVVLINNYNATNPTYSQLMSFLKQDPTDTLPYQTAFANQNLPNTWTGPVKNYVNLPLIQTDIQTNQPYPSVPRICADFAERLHNASEMAGINCGYVLVGLQGVIGGHALNAYQTTDKGLVYIDDTGATPALSSTGALPTTNYYGLSTTNDKEAYIQQGQQLGLIDINSAPSFVTDYVGYQSWVSLKAQFDSLIIQYNQLAAGQVTVSQDVYAKLQAIKAQQQALANQLGGFFLPMGIVTSFSVVWEGTWN